VNDDRTGPQNGHLTQYKPEDKQKANSWVGKKKEPGGMVPVRVKRASLVRATGDTPRTAFQRLCARLCGDSVMELVKVTTAKTAMAMSST